MDDVGFGRHFNIQNTTNPDLEITRRVVEIVTRNDAKISLAVIPNVISGSPMYSPANPAFLRLSSSPEELALLKDIAKRPEIELTLHAWTHEPLIIHEGRGSEFGGLPFEEQYSRLSKGKEELEQALGIPIDIFVPPFNNHDQVTLQAMKDLGFIAISSQARKSDHVEGLGYVPSTTSIKEIKNAISEASHSQQHCFIVALFHGYDFMESGFSSAWLSLDDFDVLLQEISTIQNVQFSTLGEAMDSDPSTHPFNAEQCQLFAKYRGGILRVNDILMSLGSPGIKLMSFFDSGKVFYPKAHMQHAARQLLLIEIFANVLAGIGGLILYYLGWRMLSLITWARLFRLPFYSMAFICFSLLLLEGIFGIIGAPGFGGRLVLALTFVSGFLIAGIIQRVNLNLRHRTI